MSDVRALVEELGYRDVRTLLNSGNVVFTVPASDRKGPAARIEKAITARLGSSARVTVLIAAELADVIVGDPFGNAADKEELLSMLQKRREADRKMLAEMRGSGQ